MSRNFEAQVEVFPRTAENSTAVAAVLRQWGMEVAGDCASFDDNYPDDGWCYWGAIPLSTESEQDKHDQLVKLLPLFAVITRWRCWPISTRCRAPCS
jgi:hypothetical protein